MQAPRELNILLEPAYKTLIYLRISKKLFLYKEGENEKN
jgi:hypothetical protein